MAPKKLIPFKIDHIDSLGQGVSKDDEGVVFIPKTLVGETGIAEVTSSRKGVSFARVHELKAKSSARIEPACPHYTECPSCHLLHTDYATELSIKEESLKTLFKKRHLPTPLVIPAAHRLDYRNRIQLHYDKKLKKIGFIDREKDQIVPVPFCQVGSLKVQEKLRSLYQNNFWLREAPQRVDQGHVEIYEKNGEAHLHWNQRYAHGGFSQVFDQMNQKLIQLLKEKLGENQDLKILDLFGGNGNLSKKLHYSKRLCVDQYPFKEKDEFFHQDLYDAKSIEKVAHHLAKKEWSPNFLIVDPPRSGMKDLRTWIEAFPVKEFVYVSCDPHSLVRDLETLPEFEIEASFLLDFFPSTYHFETVVFLRGK